MDRHGRENVGVVYFVGWVHVMHNDSLFGMTF